LAKIVPINDKPHLVFFAKRDIDTGEELLYPYGDKSRVAIKHHPWLRD